MKKQIAEDAPIPYNPNDPDDGPYDPNDDDAVDAYCKEATIWVGWPDPVMIQKDGVPLTAEESNSGSAAPKSKAS